MVSSPLLLVAAPLLLVAAPLPLVAAPFLLAHSLVVAELHLDYSGLQVDYPILRPLQVGYQCCHNYVYRLLGVGYLGAGGCTPEATHALDETHSNTCSPTTSACVVCNRLDSCMHEHHRHSHFHSNASSNAGSKKSNREKNTTQSQP